MEVVTQFLDPEFSPPAESSLEVVNQLVYNIPGELIGLELLRGATSILGRNIYRHCQRGVISNYSLHEVGDGVTALLKPHPLSDECKLLII